MSDPIMRRRGSHTLGAKPERDWIDRIVRDAMEELGIERDDFAVFSDDERINFKLARIFFGEGLVEVQDKVVERGHAIFFDAERKSDFARMEMLDARDRVHFHHVDFFRMFFGDFFDLAPALAAN